MLSENGTSHSWGVLADDLTGAMDVAAAFVQQGFSAQVILDRRLRLSGRADVVVVDTESRQLAPSRARCRVEGTVRTLARRGIPVIFKKIDSTCQGNLYPELIPFLSGSCRSCWICPANPTQGRTLRNGQLIVHDRPQFSISERLKLQGATKLSHCPNRSDEDGQSIRRLRGPCLVVVDASRESQLDRMADWAFRSGPRVLLVGAAPLAGKLAKRLAVRLGTMAPKKTGSNARIPESSLAKPRRPVMVLVGSRNPTTSEQIDCWKKSSNIVECDLGKAKDAVRHALSRSKDLLVRVPTHDVEPDQIHSQLQVLQPWVDTRHLSGLVICGGDTAGRVLKSWGCGIINVCGELDPGLAWGLVVRGSAEGLPVCTKPGGFGAPDSLATAVKRISSSIASVSRDAVPDPPTRRSRPRKVRAT
jgi:uncharacterized protein YgbK (DUF1537 family)